jgi:hypothetical protein
MFEQANAGEPGSPITDWCGQWFRYFTGILEILGGILTSPAGDPPQPLPPTPAFQAIRTVFTLTNSRIP